MCYTTGWNDVLITVYKALSVIYSSSLSINLKNTPNKSLLLLGPQTLSVVELVLVLQMQPMQLSP